MEHTWCGGSLSARVPGFLTAEECLETYQATQELEPNVSRVIDKDGTYGHHDDVRKATTYHWNANQGGAGEKIYNKIMDAALELNEECWRLDMAPRRPGTTNITEYGIGGHFKWHMDWSCEHRENHGRWLTSVVQVTEPGEYEGGALEIRAGWGIAEAPRYRGDLIVFPSFMYHRVTPVTKGRRLTLVTWLFGKGQ